jgi:hypothetical protein
MPTAALSTIDLDTLRLIPEKDLPEFCGLPDLVQADALRKIGWISRIKDAPYRSKGAVVKSAAAALDVVPGSVNRYLEHYNEKGWRGLCDDRSKGLGAKGLHPLFKSYVAGVFDPHQRDNDDGREVWRKIVDRWENWRRTGDTTLAIPGYKTPPLPTPATGLPAGWSYDNIYRLRPKAPARAMAKHDAKAASLHLPPVLTTRIGSAVLSRVLFDDQDLDNMLADGTLAISGITEAQRPVSFNCLDFYTAAHLDHHLRAMAKDPDTKRNKTLTGQEFVWFVIKFLQTWGYRTDVLGTELIFEHGTANAWRNKALFSFQGHSSFEDAVNAITGGHVFVNRSGKFEGPLFADLCFKARSAGNFKFKTWLESAFRLLRTWMQALPGPTGSNQRLNGKGELHGIKVAERELLTAISEVVDPVTQELLARSFEHELLDLQTFHALVNAVYLGVNARTEHRLEGWKQCGFTIPLWRPNERSENWFTNSELPADPEERQFMLRRVNANRDLLTKEDKLPPVEALALELHRDRQHIAKLPDAVVGLLLPRAWAIPAKVGTNHTFTLQNPLWPDTRDTYVCSWDERGRQVTLDIGKPLQVYANPFFDGRAQIYDADGSYITTLYPVVKAEPFSPEKALQQLKVRSAVKSGHEAHLRARMEDIGKTRQQARQINRELLDLTRESRRRTKRANAEAEASAYREITDPVPPPSKGNVPLDPYASLRSETDH